MKKYLLCILSTVFLLNGCSKDLPTYELDENFDTVVIKDTKYALQKLSYKGQTFISEPEQYINPVDYEQFKIGKQIGKTKDGMQIYEVENDKKRIAIQGFMYPTEFYKLNENEK